MPISVQIEDEDGFPDGEPWWHAQSTEALAGDHASTCCVRFIDPYGNTVFNRGQIPVLLEELRTVQRQHSDPQLASVLREMCEFVERAVDQVHTYVRFAGD